jgi:hypothetical protein
MSESSIRLSGWVSPTLSYRYKWDEAHATLFDIAHNWRNFMEWSLVKARGHPFVVSCDVSEFHGRLSHHRLENALLQLNLTCDIPWRLMKFLGNFSNTNSFDLPIGGPAARILSELALNQVDELLKLECVPFYRYSDDFHLFGQTLAIGREGEIFAGLGLGPRRATRSASNRSITGSIC